MVRERRFSTPVLALVAVLAALTPSVSRADEIEDTPPPGVEQLIPRGAIPAIFNPEFVPARQADISDDAWVLGVAIGDEARAYSLNLLNSYEVVNDRIGEKSFAAVW